MLRQKYLKKVENKIRYTIDCLKKPKTESLDIYTNKKRDITDYFKKIRT